jgi:hypothetical protein
MSKTPRRSADDHGSAEMWLRLVDAAVSLSRFQRLRL